MGRRGPRQLPDGVKILAGNPGNRPINDQQPRPDPTPDPCPDYLGEVARETWLTLAPRLQELNMLTELDGIQFRNLCVVEEIIQRCYRRLAKRKTYTKRMKETGYLQQLPEVAILDKAIMQMHRLSDRFGLDPIARQSLTSPKGKQATGKLRGLLSK